MSIPSLPITANAQMHISQALEGYIKNLENLFSVGQRITVKVRFLRKDQTAWQVSRKAALREAHWRAEFPDSHHATGCVERIAPFGALVRLKGRLAGKISAHNLLLIPESQQLKVGSAVEVVFGKWDYEVQGPTLHPKIEVVVTGHIEAVETEALIASANKNNRGKLQVWVLVKTDAYGIVECDISRLVKIQERFPVGKLVTVSIPLWIKIPGGFRGRIVLSESEVPPYSRVPEVGAVIEAQVVSVLGYGAFCLLADNVAGFLHHQLIVPDKKPALGKYVRPGDLLRVRVSSVPLDKPAPVLDFVTMVTPFSQKERREDGGKTLFNLKQEKRKQVAGGFKRSLSFRAAVLAAFNDTCILCGMNQRLSEDICLAEAAHIVPHSQRGADIIENALCLCPVCHWAFDKGLIGITQEKTVAVSEVIANESDVANSLRKLHGKELRFPESCQVSLAAFEWHWRNIFWDNG